MSLCKTSDKKNGQSGLQTPNKIFLDYERLWCVPDKGANESIILFFYSGNNLERPFTTYVAAEASQTGETAVTTV